LFFLTCESASFAPSHQISTPFVNYYKAYLISRCGGEQQTAFVAHQSLLGPAPARY
jgi:hypothetical protein